MTWKLAEAKNKFTEVFNKALAGEPQTISRRGEEVVMLSKKDWDALYGKKPKAKTFVEHLLAIPKIKELDLTREPWRDREVDFGLPARSKPRAKAKKKTSGTRRAAE